MSAPRVCLPGWTLSPAGLDRACRYLGLPASSVPAERLNDYLARVGAGRSPLGGFAGFLAVEQPRCIGLAALDVWSRLLLPSHPWRFRLNALTAIEEALSLERFSPPPGASRAWAAAEILAAGAWFLVGWVVGAAWMSWAAVRWVVSGGLMRRESWLRGERCIVVGASRGLGLELACRLAARGARVLCVARPGEAIEARRRETGGMGLEGRLSWLAADLRSPDALLAEAASMGWPLPDCAAVFVCAGVKPEGGLLAGGDGVGAAFETNTFAPIELARRCLTAWGDAAGKRIVLVSSLGRWHGMPATGAYNASKAALRILGESINMELDAARKTGPRLLIVEPGLIRTSLVRLTPFSSALSVGTGTAAEAVLAAAPAGKRTKAFPAGFVALTGLIVLLPQRLRSALLSRLRPRS